MISGLTYWVSLCLPNEIIYETVMNAIVLPIFFLSTALFPADRLTGVLAAAVNINPFTHVINALRDLFLTETISVSSVMPVLLMLTVMCCASFSLANWKLHKELEG